MTTSLTKAPRRRGQFADHKGTCMVEFHKRFLDTFEQMQEDFDRFFEHYANAKRPTLVSYRLRWSPPCNVYETD